MMNRWRRWMISERFLAVLGLALVVSLWVDAPLMGGDKDIKKIDLKKDFGKPTKPPGDSKKIEGDALAEARAEEARKKAVYDKAKAAFDAQNGQLQKARDLVESLQADVAKTKIPAARELKQKALDAARAVLRTGENALAPLRMAMEEARRQWEQAAQRLEAARTGLDETAKGAIRLGVSKAAQFKLLAIADADQAIRDKQYVNAQQARLQALANDLKEEQASFDEQLKKHPEFAQFKKELTALKKLDKGSPFPSAESQFEALVKLQTRYDKLFKSAYKEAGLNDKKLAAVVRKHSPKSATIASTGPGSFTISALSAEAAPPPPDCFCLEPPFSGAETRSTSFIGFNLGKADKKTGIIGGKSVAFSLFLPGSTAGICDSYAENYVTVPPGVGRMKVTAKFQTRYLLDAKAFGGFASAAGELRVTLIGQTGTAQTANVDIPETLAVFLLGKKAIGDREIRVGGTFVLPPGGGEFLIRAQAQNHSIVVLIGSAYSNVDAKVQEICVQLLP